MSNPISAPRFVPSPSQVRLGLIRVPSFGGLWVRIIPRRASMYVQRRRGRAGDAVRVRRGDDLRLPANAGWLRGSVGVHRLRSPPAVIRRFCSALLTIRSAVPVGVVGTAGLKSTPNAVPVSVNGLVAVINWAATPVNGLI